MSWFSYLSYLCLCSFGWPFLSKTIYLIAFYFRNVRGFTVIWLGDVQQSTVCKCVFTSLVVFTVSSIRNRYLHSNSGDTKSLFQINRLLKRKRLYTNECLALFGLLVQHLKWFYYINYINIYIYMNYHNNLVQTWRHFFIFGLYHTSWISCNFC